MTGRTAAFLGLGAIGAPMAARLAHEAIRLEAIRLMESRTGVEIRG